jgi:O-acetyl-ADP-ribose deacetylase
MHAAAIQRIKVISGDITELQVDAIVTAANEALVGGHGVDGAVHRKAGPGLFEECRTIGYCAEGHACITKGYLLPAKHIIHTVGPVWEGGHYDEAKLLESCYTECLKLAESNQLKSIAFPCIATGAHEYPRDKACQIAIGTVKNWLDNHELPSEVIFCCYEEEDEDFYRKGVSELQLIS